MFQQCRLIGFFSHVKTLSETKEKVVSYLGVMARCSLKNFKKTDKNHHFLAGPLFSSRTPTVLTGPVFMPTFR